MELYTTKKSILVEAEIYKTTEKPQHGIRRCVIVNNKVDCLLNEQERFPGDGKRHESHAINTNKGWVEICEGDWLIKEEDGNYYPCPHDVFIRIFEEL